jgi:putative nucleotidyltransferase with HDIG domain
MTAAEIVAQAKDLPVVSETARKLVTQLNQPDLHRDELVETVRCDNVLTAKLLRVCNSANSGLSEPVLSVDQALFLLGDSMIFRIVCAIGFSGSLGIAAPGYETEANGLWSHSLNTGLGAEYLAEAESYGNFLPSTAFTAGLLHDIGKAVMSKVLTPKERAEIRARITQESLSRVGAEKAVLGADHCEIGACLLTRWSLPELIVEAVAHHHSPVLQPSIQLSALVYLANCAVHLCGAGPGWEDQALQAKNTAATMLGLDVGKVEHVVSGVGKAMQTLPQLMVAA